MEKEEKEAKIEEKVEKRSAGRVWWLTIVMIILLIAFFGLGYALGASNIFNEVNKNIIDSTEEQNGKTDNAKIKLTDTNKAKLEKFINVATSYNSLLGGTRDHFVGGTTTLPNEIKYKMTNIAVYADKKVTQDVTATEEIANKVSGLKPDYEHNEVVDTLSVATFKSTYKELFNEEFTTKFEDSFDWGSCPAPMAIDNEAGILYYFHRCGGATAAKYEEKIISYDTDKDYYYVHQELTVTSPDENTTTKLLWKFDKNLSFVSTVKE